MNRAIVFNYFESGAQVSCMLDKSQFYKVFMTKYRHREPTEKLLGLPGSDGLNTPNRWSKHVK